MIKQLHSFATRRVFKEFAARNKFVYFGQIKDEQPLVLGITASPNHHDNFYTIGNFQNYDVTMLQRSARLRFPSKPDSDFKWLIAQVDLRRNHLPHIFIDNLHQNQTFLANLAISRPNFQDMSPGFVDVGAAHLFIDPKQYGDVRMLLSPQIVSVLSNFKDLDIEIKDDQLFVYAFDNATNVRILEQILKLTVWLAKQLDSNKI